jgi:Ca2+-binding RTX toxin-like protein
MATPYRNDVPVSYVGASGNYRIDDLLYGTKWGGGIGTPVTLTYSFPDANNITSWYWSSSDYGSYDLVYNGGEPWSPYATGLTATQQAAAVSALAQWSALANITFVKVPDSMFTVGEIRVAWTYDASINAQAWAYFPGSTPAAGDIWLNSDAYWDGTTPGDYGYLTALHELGHAMGLSHTFSGSGSIGGPLPLSEDGYQYSIMSYSALAGSTGSWAEFNPTTPMLYDIAAIQYLYGANMSYHAGDDTYTFVQGKSYFQTIWDAGGNDTIVWSATTEGATIDLRPGKWSDLGNTLRFWDSTYTSIVGTSPFTVAIYYTVTIENATGGSGNDVLIGNDVANRLIGGLGDDSMSGGFGDDIYNVDSVFDVVTESVGEGTDRIETALTNYSLSAIANVENLVYTGAQAFAGSGNELGNSIVGGAGNDTLDGSSGNDTLTGNAGNDTLIGGTGDDSLVGGLGNDVYFVDSLGDRVIEVANGGIDRVETALVNYMLGSEVENLAYMGSAGFTGTGQVLANLITGAAGNDSLSGLAGNDTLIGNSGNDTLDGGVGVDSLLGGAGNDTYIVDVVTDVVIEDAGAGSDVVNVALLGAGTYTLTANVENAVVAGSVTNINLIGNDLANVLTGSALANSLTGLAGDDSLIGGAGNDTLIGGAGADTLDAGTGIDVIDGGTEADTLIMLDSFLNYTVSRTSAADTRLVGAGQDTSLRNVEFIRFLDGTKTLTDVLNFATGFNDSIVGTSGDDHLDGLGGADTLVGLAGNDTYVVDVAADVILENLNEGTDSVSVQFAAAGTYTLGANIENAAVANTSAGVNITGNALDNQLLGNASGNILNGGVGNDTLNGIAGVDTLIGGLGNDSYYIDDLSDSIVENAGEGLDEVNVRLSVAGTYILAANLDNGVISNATAGVNLTGNLLNNILTGNALANILDGAGGNDSLVGGQGNDTLIGGIGNDTLVGGEGDDIYRVDSLADVVTENLNEGTDRVETALGTYSLASIVNVENLTYTGSAAFAGAGNVLANSIVGAAGSDTLDGGAGNDTLFGGAGNDSLIGGGGDDSLVGGAGDDIYVADSAGDVVVEAAASGIDRIETILGQYSLETQGGNVENLSYAGSGSFSGFGNALANLVSGGVGNDTLNGGAGDDTLLGSQGNDTLDGGIGNDNLQGGVGDDVYVLDVASDVVKEGVGEGADQVQLAFTSTASYTLTANVENVIVTAGQGVAINITANDLANTIVGNAAANNLSGGAGNDSITGLGGNDVIDGGLGSDTVVLVGVLADYAITRPTTTQTRFTYLPDGTATNLISVENITFSGDSSTVTLASLTARIGSVGNDSLIGSSSDDTLVGGLGDDSLVGGAGNDDLQGGDGLDTLAGGAGNDILDGGVGNDLYLFGIGGGDDIIDQNDAAATSVDTIQIASDVGNFSSGETTLSRGWQSYNDLVVAVNSTDTNGGDVVDHIVVNDYFLNDLVNPGGAIDFIRFAADGSLLTQTQVLAELLKGTAGADWLRGYANTNDAISGLAGNDQIGGAAGNDTLDGGLGNDTLSGDEGNDSLIGGSGNDVLLGGAGNDTLFGGGSNDYLEGGGGSDTYQFNPGGGQDIIFDGSGDADVLNFGAGILASTTQVSRSGNDLLIKFGVAVDQVAIQDYFAGSLIEQFRFADGGTWSSTDIFAKVLVPTAGDDQITGYLGSELLQGLAGNDTINGGAGNDTINGGNGTDLLTGGDGADRFVFNTADVLVHADTISDFVSGTDKIVLSKAVFGLSGSVGDVTNLVGLGPHFSYDNNAGALSYDADGAGAGAAISFVIIGQVTLGNDFLIVA